MRLVKFTEKQFSKSSPSIGFKLRMHYSKSVFTNTRKKIRKNKNLIQCSPSYVTKTNSTIIIGKFQSSKLYWKHLKRQKMKTMTGSIVLAIHVYSKDRENWRHRFNNQKIWNISTKSVLLAKQQAGMYAGHDSRMTLGIYSVRKRISARCKTHEQINLTWRMAV